VRISAIIVSAFADPRFPAGGGFDRGPARTQLRAAGRCSLLRLLHFSAARAALMGPPYSCAGCCGDGLAQLSRRWSGMSQARSRGIRRLASGRCAGAAANMLAMLLVAAGCSIFDAAPHAHVSSAQLAAPRRGREWLMQAGEQDSVRERLRRCPHRLRWRHPVLDGQAGPPRNGHMPDRWWDRQIPRVTLNLHEIAELLAPQSLTGEASLPPIEREADRAPNLRIWASVLQAVAADRAHLDGAWYDSVEARLRA
jgi:hypothetical protein